MPKVLIPIADGSEDLEAVTLIDLLRRADITVIVASVHTDRLTIKAARGTKITADATITAPRLEAERWDAIVLPGGMPGAEHLRDSQPLIDLLKAQNRFHRCIGAICAAPAVVLEHHSLIGGRNATCYPAMQDDLMTFANRDVVIDRELITSQGPATAMIFALTIIQHLCGQSIRDKVADALLWKEYMRGGS